MPRKPTDPPFIRDPDQPRPEAACAWCRAIIAAGAPRVTMPVLVGQTAPLTGRVAMFEIDDRMVPAEVLAPGSRYAGHGDALLTACGLYCAEALLRLVERHAERCRREAADSPKQSITFSAWDPSRMSCSWCRREIRPGRVFAVPISIPKDPLLMANKGRRIDLLIAGLPRYGLVPEAQVGRVPAGGGIVFFLCGAQCTIALRNTLAQVIEAGLLHTVQ